MIKKIEIENYKSLENLSLELGRFNVLIGENGCGKTNILESLVFAAAGVMDRVENGFIAFRGARPNEAKFFRNGFEMETSLEEIKIRIFDNNENRLSYSFKNDNQPFSKWKYEFTFNDHNNSSFLPEKVFDRNPETHQVQIKSTLTDEIKTLVADYVFDRGIVNLDTTVADLITHSLEIQEYIIYALENFFLRNINSNETYTDPVGYRGEGLFKLVKIIRKEKPGEYSEIVNHLHLIDWFENFEVNEDLNADSEFTLSDKYLEDGLKSFDVRNANEGFLFVLFYLTIFISDYTPKFFAIDNIDTALNPKLCSKLISVLVELAKKHDKQVIITTHNPSVLDGLNLNDDEQRLFVIARNKSGRTRATRIEKKPTVENNGTPVKLSEQFLRGYIGGLPKNF